MWRAGHRRQMPLPWRKDSGIEHEPVLLRTLRVKFIFMNMLLAAIVLTLAFGVICYLDYTSRLNTVYSSLEAVLSDAATPDVPQITSIQQLTNDQGVTIGSDGSLKSSGTKTSGIVKLVKPVASDDSADDEGGAAAGDAGSMESAGGMESTGGASANGEADATAAGSADAGDAQASSIVPPRTPTGGVAEPMTSSSASDSTSGAASNAGSNAASNSGSTSGSASNTSANSSSASNAASNANTASNASTSIYSVPMIGAASEIGANVRSVILTAVYNVSPDGSYSMISSYTNAAIPNNVVSRSNELALNSKSYRGLIEEYDLYFERVASPENPQDYLIAYADGSSVGEWVNLAWTLILVGISALCALFLINIFFSRWALRPVKVSIRQQAQFTADASHELKTPLTVILANMAILKSHVDANVGDELQWIDSTETEAQRMQLLVNDMLALSRPKEQKIRRVSEPVEFSDLVEGEVLQFESVAFELGVDLDGRIEEGVVINGDSERLARMVGILVDNACKYAAKAEGSDDADDADEADELDNAVDVPEEPATKADDDWISALEDVAFGDAAGKGGADAEDDGDASSESASDESVSGESAGDIRAAADDAAAYAGGAAGMRGANAASGAPVQNGFIPSKWNMPMVRVTLHREEKSSIKNDVAVLKVYNNGPIIPSDDLPHIFNRFYRADKVRTSAKGGYGLGLAIGQEIAQEHNGEITVSSSKSEGTIFTVTIPIE